MNHWCSKPSLIAGICISPGRGDRLVVANNSTNIELRRSRTLGTQWVAPDGA